MTNDADPDPYHPVIQSQADLEAAWTTLMQPLGFGGWSLWLMLLQPDNTAVPALTQIEECVGAPEPEMLAGLAGILDELIEGAEPGHRWALLRSRPGRGGADDLDRTWARGIYAACAAAGVPLEVIHLATDDTVMPLPMDEVGYLRAS